MAKVGFLVALLSAAACAWLAVEVGTLRAQLDTQQALVAELSGRSPSERAATSVAEPTVVVRGDASAPGSPSASPGDGPALAPRPSDPATLSTRMAELEKRFAEQEKAVSSLRERGPGGMAMRMPKFIHDAESAARELKLDDRQKAELERVVEGTRRELEDLRTLPNDEGMTWKEASKVKFEGSADGGALIAFGTNMQKMEAFKKSKIPGSNETFGEADQRIRRQAKDRVRRLLTPEQAKTFDDSHTEPLFGGFGGGDMAISIATDSVVSEEPTK